MQRQSAMAKGDAERSKSDRTKDLPYALLMVMVMVWHDMAWHGGCEKQ